MDKNHSRTVPFGKAVVILVLAMLIPTIILQGVWMLMYVPSESMSPTLESGDVLIGSRMFDELNRGDIVVFQTDETMLIKRIVGLPGEEVLIKPNGDVYIDGKKLTEPYVINQRKGQEQVFQVPASEYLLLGDNRQHSYDARYWDDPYVPHSAIRAVASRKLFSIPHLQKEGENT